MCCKSAFGMCDDPFQAQGRFTGWLGAGLHESLGANGTRNGLLSEGFDLKSLKTIEIQAFFLKRKTIFEDDLKSYKESNESDPDSRARRLLSRLNFRSRALDHRAATFVDQRPVDGLALHDPGQQVAHDQANLGEMSPKRS